MTGAVVAAKRAQILGMKRGVVAALVIGALLRFVDIWYQSYSMDELWEFTIVRLPAGEIVGVGDGFPPLFHLIFRALFVGGAGDFSGRVLSAVLGVATVWVASRLGRRINERVEVVAAIGVAVAPLLVLLSKEARAYGLYIFLAALLLLVTWNVLDRPSPSSWAGFIVVAALGLYTHYMFALALASAELVILWTLRRDRAGLQHWLLAHSVLAVALIPLILIALPDFEMDAANAYSATVDPGAIAYGGLSLFTGMTLGPSSRALHMMTAAEAFRGALPWVIIIGLPACYLLYTGWNGLSPEWRIRLAVPFVTPLLLLSALSALIGTAFRVRYLSWLVIPLAIWLGVGYLSAHGNLRHVAGAALLIMATAAIIARDVSDEHRVEDARGAAAYIEDHPDTPAVAMAWYMTKPIEYYLGLDSATFLPEDEGWGRFDYHDAFDNRIVPIPSPRPADPGFTEQAAAFDAAVAPGEDYFFIRSREFHADADGEYFNQRVAADGLQPVSEFAGITIYRGVRGNQ